MDGEEIYLPILRVAQDGVDEVNGLPIRMYEQAHMIE
jgi:hypothetical protein